MAEKKKGIVIGIILLLLLLAGGGGYFLLGGNMSRSQELAAIKESKSIEDLEDFLEKHPDAANSKEVKELAHTVKYEAALEDNEIGTYASFLEEFPESEHKDEIQENLDWLETEENHSNEAFEEFIEKYPDSFYIPRAKLRIGQNDFWTRTKPTRDAFSRVLKADNTISSAFYPQYAEYAAKLVAHNLIYEAAAIIAVLQYHHTAGARACLNMGMKILTDVDFTSTYATNRALRDSKVYQAKADVMMNLNFKDVMSEINKLAVSGDIELDKKQYLLDQTGAGEEVDEAEQLAKMLKYVKITPYSVMYPEFVGKCVDFLGSQAAANVSVLELLASIHLPKSAKIISANSTRYAPSNYFNGLGAMARRFREEVMAELPNLDDRGKAVMIYGLGIADDRRSKETVRNILETTEDNRLKIACWYALSRLGEDHTDLLNNELAAALEEGGDIDTAADILTAFQWMRDRELEKKIDRTLVKKALDYDHHTVLFFAQAVMEDIGEKLDSKTIARVLELSRNENDQISERASSLLAASQSSLKTIMSENFETMTENEKAMIVTSLNKETFASVETSVRPFIEHALTNSFKGDDKALNHVLGSVGSLGLNDYESQLLDILKRKNNLSAGFSLAMLYQENPEEGRAKLAGLNSNSALVARAFLGDDAAVNAFKTNIDSYSINKVLEGLNYSRMLNNTSFYSRYYAKIRYTNSRYAPTDYYVAFAAQTSAIKLLLKNRDLREEVRANL